MSWFRWKHTPKTNRELSYDIYLDSSGKAYIRVTQFLDFDYTSETESYVKGNVQDIIALAQGLIKAAEEAQRLEQCIKGPRD